MTAQDRPVATGLPPLDTAGVLWVAAIDRVPIEERVQWVEKMAARIERINAYRYEWKAGLSVGHEPSAWAQSGNDAETWTRFHSLEAAQHFADVMNGRG